MDTKDETNETETTYLLGSALDEDEANKDIGDTSVDDEEVDEEDDEEDLMLGS